jgi:hypothetical protein
MKIPKSTREQAAMTCDEYAESFSGHPAARWFIFYNRLPATLRALMVQRCPEPVLYADHGNERVRVVMASRLGDLGVTRNLNAETGYERRVMICELSNFSETP